MGRMLAKVRLAHFLGTGVIKPCFQQLGNLPNFVMWLKIFDKGSAILSEKALIKSTGMSKGQILDFLSLRILFITSEGEIKGKEVLGGIVGLEPVKGGRLCTMEARYKFRSLAVLLGGSGR